MLARLFGAAALLTAAIAAPAAAQTGTVDISGSVGVRCAFTIGNDTIALGELSVGGVGGGELDTSVVNGATAELEGWCNGTSSSMTVEANALTNGVGAPPAGFENVINYTATATAAPDGGPVSASDSSSTVGPGGASVVGIFSSTIDVELSASSTPGGGKLVAGAYSGSVDVTLSPAI